MNGKNQNSSVLLSRRTLLKSSAAAASALTLPFGGLLGPSFGSARAADGGPLFFLLVSVPSGMDSSYLFDGRAMALTAAGLKANYLGEDPEPWQGTNGTVALATKLTAPLRSYRDDFSILNGVLMAATFDGHDQNENFLLTGNPFGGESFIPHLNKFDPRADQRTPLDAMQTAFSFAAVSNNDASMPVSAASARSLVKRLNSASPLDVNDPLYNIIGKRYAANAGGTGRFSKASALMRDSFATSPRLANLLKGLAIPEGERDPSEQLAGNLSIIAEFFRVGATRSAMVAISPNVQGAFIDSHDPESARRSAETIGSIASQIAQIFKTLKETPSVGGKSLFDRTVVVVASEFSRTMRQLNAPIDNTGTDHNPLCNSVLIGGGGIKGGLVLGESDTCTADEVLSGAHLALDHDRVKIMGRPFDFSSMRPSTAKPEAYHAGDYLGFASIANTIYRKFGIADEHLWEAERNGPKASILTPLLG